MNIIKTILLFERKKIRKKYNQITFWIFLLVFYECQFICCTLTFPLSLSVILFHSHCVECISVCVDTPA